MFNYMALTPQQIETIRKQIGFTPSTASENSGAANVARRRQLAAEYDTQKAEQNKPGYLSRVVQTVKELPGKLVQDVQSGASDVQSGLSKIDQPFSTGSTQNIEGKTEVAKGLIKGAGRVAGDVAGAIFSPITEGISSIAEKTGLTKGLNSVAQYLVDKTGIAESPEFQQFALSHPNAEEDFGRILNLIAAKGVKGDILKIPENIKQMGVDTLDTVKNITAKTTEKVAPGLQVGKKVASDIIPTKQELVSGQITKALDLTQGDVSNIKLSTKNEVGDWISKNNLIGGNKPETLSKIKTLVDTQYKLVRDEVQKVKTNYSHSTVPRVKESLQMLKQELTDVLGQEQSLSEVNNLLKQKQYSLSDIQKTKELLDNQFDLYKSTGDVKAGQQKTGLANVRKELKEFIEKEVKDNSGVEIGGLNNDVATGQSIIKQASKRSTREFTRANVSLSDLGVFGSGSIIATPLGGLAAVIIKRIIETPTIRLRFAKFINSLPKKEVEIIKNKLLKGEVPEKIKNIVKD